MIDVLQTTNIEVSSVDQTEAIYRDRHYQNNLCFFLYILPSIYKQGYTSKAVKLQVVFYRELVNLGNAWIVFSLRYEFISWLIQSRKDVLRLG